MSHPSSAVLQDAAEPPLIIAHEAHEHDHHHHQGHDQKIQAQMQQDGSVGAADGGNSGKTEGEGRSESTQATQAMLTSLKLEASPVPPLSSQPSPSPRNFHDALEVQNSDPEPRITSATPAPSLPHADAVDGQVNNDQVAPPSPIVRPNPRDITITPPQQPTSISIATGTVENITPYTTQNTIDKQGVQTVAALNNPLEDTADAPGIDGGKMIFGHTQNAATAAQRRRNYANTNALTDYEADMTNKDRVKQKEAVKKFLAEKVKQDWIFEWPRPDSTSSPEATPEAEVEVEVEVAEVEINEQTWKERDEWESNASDSGPDPSIPTKASSHDTPTPSSKTSPFRFETPDGVGDAIKRTVFERKRRRKRRLADELAWNEGLKCFVARRDAWTGARRVSRASTGLSPVKTIQRESLSSEDGGSSTAIEPEEDDEWEDDIEIPVAAPFLPPENAMRASILPAAYNTIYDKVILQGLTPSCPMNLKDVTRSCVQGWKRDGEWPPKSTIQEAQKKKGRKMSIASLFGVEKHEHAKNGDKDKESEKKGSGGGIRKSIQKILNLGHAHTNGNGVGHVNAAKLKEHEPEAAVI